MREQTALAETLLERLVPEYDILEAGEIEVNAAAAETYAAIRKTDLRDPVIATLFAVPGPANRMARRLAGLAESPRPGEVTFGRIAAAKRGWTALGEEVGRELVLGTVSRFWAKERPTREVPPGEFASFSEPGWAKVALSFSVEPVSESRSMLRYEARAVSTDAVARRRFRRYWRVIRPGVVVALRRSLGRIRTEAQWDECLTGALADR